MESRYQTNKTYYKTLPRDYFDNLYESVKDNLTHNQNVCISVLRGGGARTVFNFLYELIQKDNLYNRVLIYDPELDEKDVVEVVRMYIEDDRQEQCLVIIRSFEVIKNKKATLTKLDSIRRKSQSPLTYLVISDHTATTNPSEHQSSTAIFFSNFIYIPPFDEKNTYSMIKTLQNFFGWKIDEKLYKKIYLLSGGLPRIIKYVCKDLSEGFGDFGNEERFLKTVQIDFQLERLTKLLITLPTKSLRELGLLGNESKIKSKLLKIYLKKYSSKTILEIYPKLTNTELKITSFMLENEGRVLSVDKIADILKMTDESFSLWAIYKTISRIKPKIKGNFNIINIKNRGYILKKVSN